MCHRTLLRPAAVLDVPVRDQAAPYCEAIARVNWGTRAAGTDADVPGPQRIPAQGHAHRRRHVVPCESLGAARMAGHAACCLAAADDTQPSRRSKMTRSAWDPDLIAFCSLAGRLRRLELLVDLIRNRLAALIDQSGSVTRKLREAPFPLQSASDAIDSQQIA